MNTSMAKNTNLNTPVELLFRIILLERGSTMKLARDQMMKSETTLLLAERTNTALFAFRRQNKAFAPWRP